jgi:hypothetical protein
MQNNKDIENLINHIKYMIEIYNLPEYGYDFVKGKRQAYTEILRKLINIKDK